MHSPVEEFYEQTALPCTVFAAQAATAVLMPLLILPKISIGFVVAGDFVTNNLDVG